MRLSVVRNPWAMRVMSRTRSSGARHQGPRQAHDVERVQAQRGVLTRGQGAVTDPLGRIRADQPDTTGSFGSEEIEELLEGGPVVTGLGPHHPAAVVVDDDHQVLVSAPVGDLVDPDPGEPVEGIPDLAGVGTTRPAIAPTVRHAMRISSTTAVFEACG